MKLALGLDVQTNAKGGKFMSIEDFRQGALVCKTWRCCGSPATSRTTGPRGWACALQATRPGAVDGGGGAERHRQHDHLPEALSGGRPHRLESQLQRAVKVSAKGKHVVRTRGVRKGRALVEAQHVWLMGRQWGVPVLGRLQQLGARGP